MNCDPQIKRLFPDLFRQAGREQELANLRHALEIVPTAAAAFIEGRVREAGGYLRTALKNHGRPEIRQIAEMLFTSHMVNMGPAPEEQTQGPVVK